MSKLLHNDTFWVVVFSVVFTLAFILVLHFTFQDTMDKHEWQEEVYRVRAGDSLWTISEDYCPYGVDCREWIAEIKAINQLPDSMVHPGQELIVLTPVK